MDNNEEMQGPPRSYASYRFRPARNWAHGTLLGHRLILAHTNDEIVAAAFPALYDVDAPAGERRTARRAIAARTAEFRQQPLLTEWEAGAAGHDPWRLVEQVYAIEQALLAAKDRVLNPIPDPWPEGPPIVLCRHLYEAADAEQPKGSHEWHDA